MFKDIIEKAKLDIEIEIDRMFNIEDLPQRRIYESMKYSMLAGGKRIRPILFLKTYEMVGKADYSKVLPFSVAIEMIHTYSLIHDDLPAMDNDDFRRGKLTNHKVFGEDMAILAGDGLLNLAYETMISEAIRSEDRERCMLAIDQIAKASGVRGMIGGQVVDILSSSGHGSLETLEYIHKHKTSRLIEASILSAAILAGASSEELSVLRSYAESLGLMFQIRDDILDRIGDSEVTGKTVGIDEANDKLTYVSAYGLEKSIEKTEELYRKSIDDLSRLSDYDTEFLKGLSEYLVYRKA